MVRPRRSARGEAAGKSTGAAAGSGRTRSVRGGGRGNECGVTREGGGQRRVPTGWRATRGGAGTPRDRTFFPRRWTTFPPRFDPIVPTAGPRRRSRVGIAHLEQDHPRELVVAELAAHELDRGAVRAPRLAPPRPRTPRPDFVRASAPLVHRATAPLRVVPAPPPELARGLSNHARVSSRALAISRRVIDADIGAPDTAPTAPRDVTRRPRERSKIAFEPKKKKRRQTRGGEGAKHKDLRRSKD